MDNFRHSKALGQNFLTDTNLLRAIVSDAEVDSSSVVVEVGAGLGALTQQLVQGAKHVYCYEIDHRLKEPLTTRFKDASNLTLCFCDILQQNPQDVRQMLGNNYKLVANLPYYITTPVLFYFIERVGGVQSLTVMVQKEVADRFTAQAGSKDYGAVTVALGLEFNVKKTRNVSRKLFNPVPNVDSAVVHLQRKEQSVSPQLRALVKQAFGMRRKTLVNNLAYNKQDVLNALSKMGLPPTVRGEALTAQQFYTLYTLLV